MARLIAGPFCNPLGDLQIDARDSLARTLPALCEAVQRGGGRTGMGIEAGHKAFAAAIGTGTNRGAVVNRHFLGAILTTICAILTCNITSLRAQ